MESNFNWLSAEGSKLISSRKPRQIAFLFDLSDNGITCPQELLEKQCLFLSIALNVSIWAEIPLPAAFASSRKASQLLGSAHVVWSPLTALKSHIIFMDLR